MKKIESSQNRTGAPVESHYQFPPAFLRPAEAASYLGISRRQLARLTARRIFPVSRLGRKLLLYGRGDLEKAVARFRRSAIGEAVQS
ncbi:MAG: helix-turn-helix domain-containing protein [Kiritimatiellaeota bacterium]|nr:helix-turn-helix domain-containing protein [Kiritimatiellota bacterium]